jgi:DtxR family transcriptional regulator, Mn-dependent transcriptional regulator
MKDERIEEYLEAIYKRQSKKLPVTTSSLAEDLKVSPPAVTDMLRHLDKQGFIAYRPNKGSTLTALGSEKALGIVRRHRLWERFLTDILGMKWDKVHEEACKLEHIASPSIEDGLVNLLGDVDTCPHGHSIPDKNGNIKNEKTLPLSKLEVKTKACLLAVSDEDPKLLRNMEKLGLKPGIVLQVLKRDTNGLIYIQVNKEKVQIKSDLAASLLVKPLTGNETICAIEDVPLSRLISGQTGVIKSYVGSRGMLGRCLTLGFTPGSLVKMIRNYRQGPLLVKVRDSEVALGRQIAEKILVNPN